MANLVLCSKCMGKGVVRAGDDSMDINCTECAGKGKVPLRREQEPPIVPTKPCSVCNGSGEVQKHAGGFKRTCGHCGGKGSIPFMEAHMALVGATDETSQSGEGPVADLAMEPVPEFVEIKVEREECNQCAGKGYFQRSTPTGLSTDACKKCHGEGKVVKQVLEIIVDVPAQEPVPERKGSKIAGTTPAQKIKELVKKWYERKTQHRDFAEEAERAQEETAKARKRLEEIELEIFGESENLLGDDERFFEMRGFRIVRYTPPSETEHAYLYILKPEAL